MDWLRRNWPDLLIGVALVAVIAGIIATLISGGSFFPVGKNARVGTDAGGAGQTSTTQSSTLSPTPPAPDGAPTSAAAPAGGAVPGGAATTAQSGPAAAADPADVGAVTPGATPSTGAQGDSPISVLPPSGAPAPAAGGTSGPAATGAPSLTSS